jgi:FAD/FMN-containing dehydrogenase
MSIDAKKLARDLHGVIDGEVRFGAGTRALYTTGGSNYRQVPIGVVIPKTIDDVVTTMEICRAHDAPVLSRGGGTSLAGQCCNVAVMIDHSKYLRGIVDVDADSRLARVQPGVVLDQLRHRTQQQYGLTFGPDPSTHDHCTFGGMIGNNSCGVRSIMAQFHGPGPRTSDNVHELEVLLYDGRKLRLREGTSGDAEIDRRLLELRDRYADLIRERYPNIPRRVSGYNLDDLLPEKGFHVARALVGTESTCVTVLEATVHLIDNPPARSLLVLGYEDKYRAADDVMRVLAHKPNGLEGVDHRLAEDMQVVGVHDEQLAMLPEGRGWLLVEFGGDTKQEADDRARECMNAVGHGDGAPTGMKLYDDPQQE